MVNCWHAVAAILFAGITFNAAAEDGVTDSAILIGQTIGLSGTIAGPAKEMNEGANAYFASVNKQGGIYGRKIVLRTLDDKFDPDLAASNAKALIRNERVFALFQSRGTPHTEAMMPVLEAERVPLIAPHSGAQIFHAPLNRLVFNVRAKYQDEVAKAVEHFATMTFKDIGLLYVEDSFGRDGLDGFKAAMAARKLTPAIVAAFDRVKPDYAAAAAAVIKANPNALIVVSSAKNTIELIKAIRAQGSKIQIMTLSNNSSQSFVNELGHDGVGVIVSQVTPAPHLVTSTLGQEFKIAAKASGATVSYAAMEGYVNAKVLVEGLRRASRKPTRESLIAALESMHRVDLGGVLITYGSTDHSGSEFVELSMIGRDGRFVR